MKNSKTGSTTESTTKPTGAFDSTLPLLRNNFIVMIVAGVLIVVGFILMLGPGSGTDAYNPDIFSTRRIVIGPMLSFLGYVLMGIAIIVKPKGK